MEKTSDETNSAKETKVLDTLDATAAMFVGALAKNVMEGGTKMFEKLIQVKTSPLYLMTPFLQVN